MVSNKVHWSTCCSLKNSEHDDDISELQQKLTSIGWIQCDISSCLKWRKVRLEVAQLVKEDTPWTCDMNEDRNYNRCSIPEEDTAQYDKLAKRVNLDIVTSTLKPGYLVWAKVCGYCRWPALITADPLSGEHLYEDKTVQYHVEFLGGRRSHGWVSSKLIEVFGTGNMDLPVDKRFENSSSKIQKINAKRGRKVANPTSRVKYKDGSHKVQKAIQEALQLLPLQFEGRLKTCRFVSAEDVDDIVASGMRNGKKKVPEMKRFHNLKHKSPEQEPSFNSVLGSIQLKTKCTGLRLSYRNDVKSRKLSFHSDNQQKEENLNGDVAQYLAHDFQETNRSESKIKANMHREVQRSEFLAFPSMLLNTSKEERFMKDVQMYQQNEFVFEQEIAQFMLKCGLQLPDAPMWQNIQVSKYSIFLAVLERDGFLKVCEQQLWQSVYTEVTHQHYKLGGSLVKIFYKRNLYPFELYIHGHDYTVAVYELHRNIKTLQDKASVSEAGDSGVDTDDLEALFDEEECGFDSPDVVKHLDELDQILKSLDQKSQIETDDKDQKVQIVPHLDVAVEDSIDSDGTPNSKCSAADVQVLHEMQALQYDLDLLQDQIDLL